MKEKPSYFSTWETLKGLRIILFIGCLFTVLVSQNISEQDAQDSTESTLLDYNNKLEVAREIEYTYHELQKVKGEFKDSSNFVILNYLYGRLIILYRDFHSTNDQVIYYLNELKILNSRYYKPNIVLKFYDWDVYHEIGNYYVNKVRDLNIGDPLIKKYKLSAAINFEKSYELNYHYNSYDTAAVWLKENGLLGKISENYYSANQYEKSLEYLKKMQDLNFSHYPFNIDTMDSYYNEFFYSDFYVYSKLGDVYEQLG